MARSYPQRRITIPEDATEVVLVRHGASQAAEEGVAFAVVDGHADPPLADAGHEQARLVGARLAAGDPIDTIFTTGLSRTRETAQPLVDATGIEPVELPGLREVHLGDWEGAEFRIRIQSGDPIAMRALAEQRWDVIPGAEPAEAFAARVSDGFEQIVATTGPGRRAVAFLHGAVIGEICRQVAQSRPFAFVHVENASISRVVAMTPEHRLLRDFNVTTHLDASTA